jgi:ribosome-binding factor A
MKPKQLASRIQRALTTILYQDVKNNHLGFLTITECRLTNDFSFLTVYYTVLGNDEKKDRVVKELEQAKGFIRTKLGQHIKMRKIPQIIFKYDESLDRGNRISEGLKDVV